MKEVLFAILIIILTPIYIIIKIFTRLSYWMIEITDPISMAIGEFVDDMVEFWKKIFIKKRKNDNNK